MKQAIGAALQAIVVLALFGATLFFFLLPSRPDLRIILSDILLNRSELCTQTAMCLLGASFFFLIGFYWINRGYYLVLKMGKHSLAIDEKILLQTLEPLLEKRFASRVNLERVSIEGSKQLSFGLEIASQSDEEKEALLSEVEGELEALLRERFGYRRPFKVQVS